MENIIDLITNDMQVEYNNPLFSGELIGEISFGVRIPLTSNNRRLLQIYNPLHYNPQSFSVMISDPHVVSHDAELTLDRVDIQENIAEGTLYINKHLYTILNTPIAQLNPDTEATIVAWHCFSYRYQWYESYFPQFSSNRIAAYCNGGNRNWFPDKFSTWRTNTGRAYRTGYYAFKSYQYHPNIALSELMNKLNGIAGLNLEFSPEQIEQYNITRILSTRKRVSPHNTTQWVYWSGDNTNYPFSSTDNHYRISVELGGQHIANNLEGVETEDFPRITFNRSCKLKMTRYSCSFKKNGVATVSGTLKLKIFDLYTAEKYELVSLELNTQGEYQALNTATTQYNIAAGDYIELSLNGVSGSCQANKLRFWSKFEITEYEVTEEDYNSELQYNSGLAEEYIAFSPNMELALYNERAEEAFIPAVAQAFHKNNNGTLLWDELPCYSYFGIYANLGELTFTDLLLALCYNHNLIPSIDALTIALNNIDLSQYQTITRYQLTSIEVMNDTFAQSTNVKYGDDQRQLLVHFRGANLEKETDLYEMQFGTARPLTLGSYRTISFPQYTISDSEPNANNVTYQGNYTYNDLPPIFATTEGNLLGHISNPLKIKALFSYLQSSCIYNFSIYEPILHHLLSIEGHLYIVHSYTINIPTGTYTLKAIKL